MPQDLLPESDPNVVWSYAIDPQFECKEVARLIAPGLNFENHDPDVSTGCTSPAFARGATLNPLSWPQMQREALTAARSAARNDAVEFYVV